MSMPTRSTRCRFTAPRSRSNRASESSPRMTPIVGPMRATPASRLASKLRRGTRRAASSLRTRPAIRRIIKRRMLADLDTLEMRAILRIIAVVLFLTVIGLAAFVALPTLSAPSRVNYAALITKHSAMIRLVPSDAEDVILVPSAGSTLRLLRSNSVARDALRQLLPAAESAALPWALGGGDLVAWRTDHDSGFIVRTDAMRRILLPLFSSRIGRSGEYLVSGRSSGGFELPDLENLL